MSLQSVIETGGKQYRVRVGDVLSIERIVAEVGEKVVFDKVLLVDSGEPDSARIGAPYVEGAKVVAEVKEQKRDKKIRIIKFKRRKHYKREKGHRQYLSVIQVLDIEN